MGKNYDNVLLEDMNAKIDAIIEALQPLPTMQRDINTLKNDVAELKDDVKTIKGVLKPTNSDLRDHERRITILEAA